MKYRVSFYRKAEVVAGRAPRYMVDIAAKSEKEAKSLITEPGVVIRSVYKPLSTSEQLIEQTEKYLKWANEKLEAPNLEATCGKSKAFSGLRPPHTKHPTKCRACLQKFIKVQTKKLDDLKAGKYRSVGKSIRPKPSYVFVTPGDRNKWYSSHKSTQKERLCHVCKKSEVERYKRICKSCQTERSKKLCVVCKEEIPAPSRRRYCDNCSGERKETQEKTHREKRSKQNAIERIREQVEWAEEQLKNTSLPNCKMSSRFQGFRLPHTAETISLRVASPTKGTLSDIAFTSGSAVPLGTVVAKVGDREVLMPRVGKNIAYGTITQWAKENGDSVKKKETLFKISVENPNRCRACLQKFIDVQTVYLSNLLAGEPETNPDSFIHSLTVEKEQGKAVGA